MKNIQTFIVIAFAFFINGCASQYTPPTSGSQAKVTYIFEANNNALQVFYGDFQGSCRVSVSRCL